MAATNRVKALICLALVLCASLAAPATGMAAEKSGGFSVIAGPRLDNLDWNIAGDSSGGNPNVLSELTWSGLETFGVRADYTTTLHRFVYVHGYLGWGWIYDGENQDSDYKYDDRTFEFSRSNNGADNGDVFDASAGVGLKGKIALGPGVLEAAPLIGYSYHAQDLTMTNGYQTVYCGYYDEHCFTSTPPLGSFPGLDSTYGASWYGPWTGIEASYKVGRFTAGVSFEYHLADYHATADWNLRDDFEHPTSFEHIADGYGYIAGAGIEYAIDRQWSFVLDLDYQRWKAEDGIDRTYIQAVYADLYGCSVCDTRLNEVNWDSASAMMGLKYGF
jgi:hypothetical protein